jgi:hypothetical protein
VTGFQSSGQAGHGSGCFGAGTHAAPQYWAGPAMFHCFASRVSTGAAAGAGGADAPHLALGDSLQPQPFSPDLVSGSESVCLVPVHLVNQVVWLEQRVQQDGAHLFEGADGGSGLDEEVGLRAAAALCEVEPVRAHVVAPRAGQVREVVRGAVGKVGIAPTEVPCGSVGAASRLAQEIGPVLGEEEPHAALAAPNDYFSQRAERLHAELSVASLVREERSQLQDGAVGSVRPQALGSEHQKG